MYAWPGYQGVSSSLGTYDVLPVAVTHRFTGGTTFQNTEALIDAKPAEPFAILSPTNTAPPTHTDAPSVVLDFGREIAGRLLVVLGAMTWLGYPRSALDWMRTYWGGMLAEGATSFWESYDLRWPKDTPHLSPQAESTGGFFVSLAHGWSSGPSTWLSEQVPRGAHPPATDTVPSPSGRTCWDLRGRAAPSPRRTEAFVSLCVKKRRTNTSRSTFRPVSTRRRSCSSRLVPAPMFL
ncbi:MAG: Alpha-L-rhamnosidase N-terminal domain [Edaphobacter sp.]|nr:Alpha-L-rhamnosidase N-terminal domain [Edaphobacter sp.]